MPVMELADPPSGQHFQSGSAAHWLALGACLLLVVSFALAGHRARRAGDEKAMRSLRLVAGWGCLVAWVVNTAFWCLPGRFDWSISLPLQFCNLANLIGAAAVLGRGRYWKTILYFWMPTLCLWAFLTPVLRGGPATVEFWIFWGYHVFIPLALAEVLAVQGYRPGWADFRGAWLFTVGYMAALAVLDHRFGWNYGFVGPSKPDTATLIDFLGPYPWRLLSMIGVGTGLFLLVLLPGLQPGKRTG